MVVDLDEAPNGHLLMPLTGNLLERGRARATPFTSLDAEEGHDSSGRLEATEKVADQGSSQMGHGDKGNPLLIGTSLTRCYTECVDCHLFSVCRGTCFYCEQDVDDEKGQENLHTTHKHTPQCSHVQNTSGQNSALQAHLATGDNARRYPCRVGCQVGEGRDHRAETLDGSSDEGAVGRDPRSDGPHTTGAPISAADEEIQVSLQEEGGDLTVYPEPRRPCPWQHDHRPAFRNGGTDHHRTISTNREGLRGLWQTCEHDLRGGSRNGTGVPVMGMTAAQLEAALLGSLGSTPHARERHEGLQEGWGDQRDRSQARRHQPVYGKLHKDLQQGQSHQCSIGKMGVQGPGDSGPESADRAAQEGEGADSTQALQEPEGDVSAADVERFLSETMVAKLMREWQPQKNLYSGQCQHQRPFLMELACYSDSPLSGEVLHRFGARSAIRCSEWNWGDLETTQGVAHAKELIRRHRPIHLWISCTIMWSLLSPPKIEPLK